MPLFRNGFSACSCSKSIEREEKREPNEDPNLSTNYENRDQTCPRRAAGAALNLHLKLNL
jgi:hypothetical protein